MAIHNYCGLPGSGKSYSVVEQVLLPALRDDRRIVTNLPLRMEVIYEVFPGAEVELFDLQAVGSDFFDLDAHLYRRGAVWIIDECWKRWPQGTRVDAIPGAVGAFFAEHRHFVGEDGFSTEIVLVCQSVSQIAAFIRELVDTTYISRKLDKVGVDGKFRVDVYQGPQQLTRPDQEQLLRQAFGSYDKSVWRFYRSHTRNRTVFGSGKEKVVGRSVSIWRSPIFVLGGPALVLSLFLIYTQFGRFFGSRYDESPPVAGASPLPPTRPVSAGFPVQAAPSTRSPPASTQWRLVGIVWRSPRDGLAVIRHTEGYERVVPIRGSCSTVRGVPGEWECVIAGELVASWTGSSRRPLSL